MRVLQFLATLVVLPAACIAAILPAATSHDLIRPRSPIVGGRPQRLGAYPYVVSVVHHDPQTNTQRLLCGGTLLSYNVVLTARHCFDGGFTAKDIRVWAGSLKWSATMRDRVQRIEFHPTETSFGNTAVYGEYHVDAALLILNAGFDPRYGAIGYATLPAPSTEDPPEESLVLATGWGMFKKPDPGVGRTAADFPSTLMGVFLTTMSRSKCVAANKELVPTGSHRFCSHSLVGDKTRSACNKDSGGPIIDERKKLIGIISEVHGECGAPGTITVATSVNHLVPWIANVIKQRGRTRSGRS